jgi:hypothetical protein
VSKIIMNKRIVVAAVSLMALLGIAPPVFGQAAHEFFGPPMPIQYDSEGGRHWMVNGYSGPWDSARVSKKGAAKAVHNSHARSTSRPDYVAQSQGILVRNKHAAGLSKGTR